MSFVYILWHKFKKTEFEPKGFRGKKISLQNRQNAKKLLWKIIIIIVISVNHND